MCYKQGLNSVLITDSIGGKQTICSQGIIHGGLKYALSGVLSNDSEDIKDMPAVWKAHLQDAFFSNVRVLSEEMLMVPVRGVTSKLVTFLGSSLTKSRTRSTRSAIFPTRTVYALNEQVIDVASLVDALGQTPNIVKGRVSTVNPEGKVQLDDGREISGQRIIVTAGEGNAVLAQNFQDVKTQLRPLRMLHLQGDLPDVYAHLIGDSSKPKATITSKESGWYIGGEIAEKGVQMPAEEFLPWAISQIKSFGLLEGQTKFKADFFDINRAECQFQDGAKPPGPSFRDKGCVTYCWPTKLAYAPLVAEKLLPTLATEGRIEMQSAPRPEIIRFPF